jgi:hypothetical protein
LLNQPLSDEDVDNEDLKSIDLFDEEAVNNSNGFLTVTPEEKLAIDRVSMS